MTRPTLVFLCGLTLATPAIASAQNRQEQQMFADLRILQEQTAKLQLTVNLLVDVLKEATKTLNTRIDDQTNKTVKGFADQGVAVGQLADSERTLRSKIDETQVRLGSLEAEEQTIRQQIVALQKTLDQALAPPVLPPGDMPQATGAPGGATGTGAPPAPLNGLQIKRMYDSAFQDFVGGEFELAIQGFEGYLRNAPNAADAPEAQFQIGQAQFALGKNKEAVQAYTTLITAYKGSPREAESYFKRGLAYVQLNQKDRAKQDFEYVIKNFPDNISMVTLAQQRLDAIK